MQVRRNQCETPRMHEQAVMLEARKLVQCGLHVTATEDGLTV